MKLIKLLLLLGIIPMIFAACSDDDNPTNPGNNNSTEYFPLKVGNWWKYSSPNDDVTEYTVTITSDTLINGKTYFIGEGTDTSITFMRWENGNLYMLMPDTTGMNWQNVILMKSNPSVGSKWSWKIGVEGLLSEMNFEVMSTGGSRTVEGKSFSNVVRVKRTTKLEFMGQPIEDISYMYFAKGVGLIEVESEDSPETLLEYYVQ